MAEVKIVDVEKSYNNDDVYVFRNVNLDIKDGEFVVFVGPSGCGKSTLMRMVCGLEDVTGGEIFIDGEKVNDVPPAKRGVGMVFQSYALYPHMTVRENMGFGLKLRKTDKGTINERVDAAAKMLKLEPLLERKPKDMSGGQRQRVAIGRSLVQRPRVYLFDEPLSNLDAGLRVDMRISIAQLHKDLDATMIYVTHDQVEAMTLADKIVVLSAGKDGKPGRCEQVGAPLDLYHTPANIFVAGFIGSPKMNFIKGSIKGPSDSITIVELETGDLIEAAVDTSSANVGDSVTLGVRPEHTFVHADDDGFSSLNATIKVIEHLGSESYLYMDAPGCEDGLTTRIFTNIPQDSGDSIVLGIPADAVHLFDQSGEAFTRTRINGGAGYRK